MALRNGRLLDKILNPLFIFEPSQTVVSRDVDANNRFIQRYDIRNNGIKTENPYLGQNGSNYMPGYIASGIGGRPCIQYLDNYRGWDRVKCIGNGQVFSAMIVCTTTIQQNYNRIMSFGQLQGGLADYNNLQSFDVEQANGSTQFRPVRNSTYVTSAPFTENRPMCIIVVFDGSTQAWWLNGKFIGSLAQSGTFDIQQSVWGNAAMGGYGGNLICATQMAEAAAWTQDQIDWIAGVAAWDNDNGQGAVLVADLPANHPYKTARPQFDDGSGGSDQPVSLSDVPTISDASTARAAVTVSVADTGTLADTQSGSLTAVQTADTGTLADSATVRVGIVVSAADTGTLADSATARAAVAVTAADTGTLSDGQTTQAGATQTVADTGALADASTVAAAAQPAAADTGSIADAQTIQAAAVASLADAGVLSDTATATATSPGTGSIADTGTLSDGVQARAAAVAAVADTGILADATTALAAVSGASSDTLVPAETITVAVGIVVSAADTASLSEAPAMRADARPAVADAGTLADLSSLRADIRVAVADTGTYGENLAYTVVQPAGPGLIDTATLMDSATVCVGVVVTVADVLVPVSRAYPFQALTLSLSDTLSAQDGAFFTPSGWYDISGVSPDLWQPVA